MHPQERRRTERQKPHAVVIPLVRQEKLRAVKRDWLWTHLSPEGRAKLLKEHELFAGAL